MRRYEKYNLLDDDGQLQPVDPERLFRLYYDRPNFITPNIIQYYYQENTKLNPDAKAVAIELSEGRSFSGQDVYGVTVLDVYGVIYTDYVLNITSNEDACQSFPTLTEAKDYINKIIMDYEK